MGINTPWTGGTRIHVLALAKALLARGHRLSLVTDQGVLEEEMLAAGIPFERRVDGLPAMLELLAAAVERAQPDVLHAHPHESIPESYLLSKMTGIPFVATIHGEYLMHFRRDSLGARIADAVHSVIAVSDRVREFLIRNSSLPAHKICVIPNGIDTDEFHPGRDGAQVRERFGIQPHELVVMYLGRLDSDKGEAIMATAEAIFLLARHGIPARGVFVGNGNMARALNELSAKATGDNDRERLILAGFRRDIPELLSMADLVVATGRSALEALAAGKPVLAFGRAGYLGLVRPELWKTACETNFGDHGLLPHPSSNLLAGEIERLCRDGLDGSLAAGLRELVVQAYDVKGVVRELEDVYAKAYSAGGRIRPERV